MTRGGKFCRQLPGALVLCVLWLPALASAADRPARFDTLDVRTVMERQRATLDSLLLPESTTLDTTGILSAADSLDRGGASAIRERAEAAGRAHGHAGVSLVPFALTDYQRVDGLRLGLGGEGHWNNRLRADAAGAYGLASYDWSWRGALEYGRRGGPRVRLSAAEMATPFGPTPPGKSLGGMALVIGQDRRDYLRRRTFECEIAPWRSAAHALSLHLFERRDATLGAATDFHFVGGGTPMEAANPAITDGVARGGELRLRLGRTTAPWRCRAEAGASGGPAGGDFEYNWQNLQAEMERPVLAGGTLLVQVTAANVGGSPPAQAAAYLGGDATLRGYERLAYAGRQSAAARVEYACGVDLLRESHIPLLEWLHLQFIPFLDAGSTWGDAPAVASSAGSLDGAWRASAGLGMRRTLWLPGLEALRLDVMRRTDRGHDAWSAWLRVVSIEP